jgi:hypothetical protein
MSAALHCPTCNLPSLVCISRSSDGIDWAPAYPHHICEKCGMTWVECQDDKGPFLFKVSDKTSRLIGWIPTQKLMYLTVAFVTNRFRARHTPQGHSHV